MIGSGHHMTRVQRFDRKRAAFSFDQGSGRKTDALDPDDHFHRVRCAGEWKGEWAGLRCTRDADEERIEDDFAFVEAIEKCRVDGIGPLSRVRVDRGGAVGGLCRNRPGLRDRIEVPIVQSGLSRLNVGWKTSHIPGQFACDRN